MRQPEHPRLVLASSSSARRMLLAAAGVRFDVQAAAVDEAAVKANCRRNGLSAGQTALRLARLKAERIAPGAPDALVIGADQLLTCEGRWFDKPADLPDARAQLQALRGRTHELATAVVCCQAAGCVWQHVATPRLAMRPFSDAFLDAYLAAEGTHILGCVGAYRLEGPGVQLFGRVEGDHAAILGLPLLPLLDFLRRRSALAS